MSPVTLNPTDALREHFGGDWTLIRTSDCMVFTDGARVAKVERISGRAAQMRNGVISALRAVDAGLPAVRPIEEDLVETPIGLASMWPYVEHSTPEPVDFDVEHAMTLGLAISQCEKMEGDAAVRFDPWGEVRQRIAESVASPEITRLVNLVTDEAQANLVIPEESTWAMAHGDASARNVLCQSAGWVLLIDFDYSGMYPKNWDLACLRHQLLRTYGNEPAYRAVEEGWSVSTSGTVSSEELDTLEFLAALLATVFAVTFEPTTSRTESIINRCHDMLKWLDTGLPPARMVQIG